MFVIAKQQFKKSISFGIVLNFNEANAGVLVFPISPGGRKING